METLAFWHKSPLNLYLVYLNVCAFFSSKIYQLLFDVYLVSLPLLLPVGPASSALSLLSGLAADSIEEGALLVVERLVRFLCRRVLRLLRVLSFQLQMKNKTIH